MELSPGYDLSFYRGAFQGVTKMLPGYYLGLGNRGATGVLLPVLLEGSRGVTGVLLVVLPGCYRGVTLVLLVVPLRCYSGRYWGVTREVFGACQYSPEERLG